MEARKHNCSALVGRGNKKLEIAFCEILRGMEILGNRYTVS